MEIEPTPQSEYLANLYAKLPDATLEAEQTRLTGAVAELAGRLSLITQIRERNNG